MYEGKVKSGGYAKYNIAQVLNGNLDGSLYFIQAKSLQFLSRNVLTQTPM